MDPLGWNPKKAAAIFERVQVRLKEVFFWKWEEEGEEVIKKRDEEMREMM